MKKLQNVLYVTLEDGYLHVEGDTVCVRAEGEIRGRFPGHILESIACFGNTTVSSPLLAYCGERGIGLSFFSEHGRFMGRLEGPVRGNVLLRTKQYAVAQNPDRAACFAQILALCKTANSRTVLLRAARESGAGREEQGDQLLQVAGRLSELARGLGAGSGVESIRGMEGAVAQAYFGAFPAMIRQNSAFFAFQGRSRRPPLDPVNAVLSFLYAMLAHDYRSALEGVGLDPCVGFLHTMRPGRPSLALDMMEELRAPLCDRLTLSLINLRVLSEKEFDLSPTAVYLNEKGRKEVLTAWQKRRRETIAHEYLGEQIEIGLIPHIQAQLMARSIRGELENYPPFLWR
jgi:CRISPR-associated protein Cas1